MGDELCLIIIFRKRVPFIWSYDFEVALSNLLLKSWRKKQTATSKFAVCAMLDSTPEQKTAERESADTVTNSDQRNSSSNFQICQEKNDQNQLHLFLSSVFKIRLERRKNWN